MNLYQRTVMFLALRAAREKSQICCTAYKRCFRFPLAIASDYGLCLIEDRIPAPKL
jgi:hypothetical protein